MIESPCIHICETLKQNTYKRMETKKNKFISVSYKLYAIADDKKELVEETSNDRPFQFITGFGVALDGFEMAVEVLEQGADFNF